MGRNISTHFCPRHFRRAVQISNQFLQKMPIWPPIRWRKIPAHAPTPPGLCPQTTRCDRVSLLQILLMLKNGNPTFFHGNQHFLGVREIFGQNQFSRHGKPTGLGYPSPCRARRAPPMPAGLSLNHPTAPINLQLFLFKKIFPTCPQLVFQFPFQKNCRQDP